jgi:hypothetical protein
MADESQKSSPFVNGLIAGAVMGLGAALFFEVAAPVVIGITGVVAVGTLIGARVLGKRLS